jgi:hypothetical protein
MGVETRMLVVGHQSLALHCSYEPEPVGVTGISMDPVKLCHIMWYFDR